MEKITTKKGLIECLKDVRAVEYMARKNYIEDIANFSNSKIIKTITLTKNDEDKHLALLDSLITMLNGKN